MIKNKKIIKKSFFKKSVIKIARKLGYELIDQSDVGLTTLLLPEVALGLDENDFLSIMSYEGFQLK